MPHAALVRPTPQTLVFSGCGALYTAAEADGTVPVWCGGGLL